MSQGQGTEDYELPNHQVPEGLGRNGAKTEKGAPPPMEPKGEVLWILGPEDQDKGPGLGEQGRILRVTGTYGVLRAQKGHREDRQERERTKLRNLRSLKEKGNREK